VEDTGESKCYRSCMNIG